MNLFKKVLIVGLATMALGSAAMGDGKLPCEVGAQNTIKAGGPSTGGAGSAQSSESSTAITNTTTTTTTPTTPATPQ